MDNNELLQSIRQIVREELQPVVLRLDTMDLRLDRMEQNQNEDIIGLLNVINEKLENCATKDEVAAIARIQGEQFMRIEMMRKAK